MNIQAVMTTPAQACNPNDSLDTAARLMWEHDCGCVPVIGEGGQVLAMLTDRDVCMAAYTQGRSLGEIPVLTAMSAGCHSVSPGDPVAKAERLMQEHQVRRLPVVDDQGRLVGVVSLSDLCNEAVRERRQGQRDVTLDEVGATLSAVCQPRLGQEREPAATAATPFEPARRRPASEAVTRSATATT